MARYIPVAVLNMSTFLLMLGVGMTVALLPQQIMNLSGSVSEVGYLASAFALTFVLFQIPMGKLADKVGFKPFLVGGYFLCSFTGLLYYFSESSELILLGRMLQGIGEVPIWALAPAILSIQHPDQKGKFMGIYNASMHCGLTAGSLLGIWFCRIWQASEIFLLFTGMSLLGGLLVALFLKIQGPEAMASQSKISGIPQERGISLMGNPANQTVLAGAVLYGAGYGSFISIIPAFLIRVKNCDQAALGIFFVFFYIALGLSQLIAGPFSDQKGRKSAMVCGMAMAAVGPASLWAFELPWLIGFLTMAAFGLGAFCVSAMAFLNECVPSSLKGTISTVFYFFWGAGYFFGPLLLGKMWPPEYWARGFLFFAGFFMIEFIACLIVLKGSTETLHIKYLKG